MMDAQWWWRTFYIGLVCVTFIHAEKCSIGCKGGSQNSVYNFNEGTVYKYEVDGLSVTQLPGSPNDVAKLSISATAEVSAQSQCTYVLKLSNVQVAGTDGKKYDDLSADCAKPVKFSLNNGELSSEVCTEQDDSGASLNIKRAIISLFQTSQQVSSGKSQDVAYELDVFGGCPTSYQISNEGSKTTVIKTRDLNNCAYRENFDFPFLSTPYVSSKSDFQTSPLLIAKLEIIQEIENGILKKASGGEEYEYRPLLTPKAAATISNKFTLSFKGANRGSVQANGNEPASIIFETPHPSDGTGNADSIIKALQKVVNDIEPAVDQSAAENFLELVDVLEHVSKANILTVYSQIKSGAGFRDKEVAKNLLLDGLLFAGSAESVEAAADLLHSNEISEESSLKWYLDLNFVKHVSKGSIKAVTSLIDDNAPHQAYLGIGALAGKYCRQHDCINVPEFQQLLQKLVKPILNGCKVNSVEQENNVIASLKGLANVQQVTDTIAAKLVQCAEDSNVRTRIRSFAISAYSANALLKKSAIKIFKDVDEDAELRIKAYLALVDDPCPQVADVIKETIDKEPVHQVGSYVVSHLRNLRASTNPNREAAKHFLGQIIPKKKFPFDVRKFSQNRELSYSLDALNIGAVGEANTIYSQKSYLPRFINLNLTSNIFGHSFNFLEVVARAENLEYILEKYFGPKGEYNKSPNDVVEDTAEAGERLYDKYHKHFRNRRSVSKQQINDVSKKVKLGVDYEDRSVDLDLSLKLFGAEVGWLSLNGDKSGSLNKLLNKVSGQFGESVDKLRNFNVDYKKARTFIDATVTYPTVFGLALKVKVLGGSAVNIKVDSKLDIKEIIQAIKDKNTNLNTDIKLQIIPSAAIELSSLISIDADIIQSGVKASANIHSSTGTDITLRILDGSGVDLKVGLPVKNQELVSFKSNVVSIVRERGHPAVSSKISFDTKRTNHGGCFDQLNSVVGLTFCGEFSIPTDGFMFLSPAYGPSTVVLRLEKDDESLSSYHFRAYYNDKNPHARSFELLLDTPNSKFDRKLSLTIKGSSEPQKELSIVAVSPWKSVSIEGFVTDTNSEQSLTAKLINDNQIYSLKVGAEVSGDANRKKYEPLLEYKEPEGTKQWSLVGRKGGVKGKTQQSLGITGAVIVEKQPGSKHRKYELKSVTVTTQYTKFTLDGDVEIDDNSLESDLTITHDKNVIKLNSKLQCTGKKYVAEFDFVPQQQKEFGVSFKWNFEKEKHKLENNLVLVHGPDLQSKDARFTLSQSLEYNFESSRNFEFETKNSLSYPLFNVEGKFDIELSPKEIELEFKAGYDKISAQTKLEAKTGIKHTGDYNIEFSAKLSENSVLLSAKHDIISEVKSKFTNSLELKPGGKYQLNAIIVYDFKGKEINQAIEADLTIPFDPKHIKLNAELKNNKAESSVVFVLFGANKPIIEVKGFIEKSNKPEGNFKVYIPAYIDSSGTFKFDGHKGAGSFNLELPRLSREVEGKGEVQITSSNYKGFAELFWDKKNPSNKFRVETDTDYSENSVDSKNSLQVLDYKTVFNLKGKLEGKLTDGTIIGETEVGLPSGRFIVFKVNRKLHLKPADNEIQATYELYNYESKGAQPQKVVFKLAGKNIDPKRVIFDGQADLTYTSSKQESIALHLAGNKTPKGDNWLIAAEGSVSGSLLKPVNLKLTSELADTLLKGELPNDSQLPPAQYHLTASDSNSGFSVAVNGKTNGYHFNNDIDLTLPDDSPIKTFKWSSVNFLKCNPPQGQFKQVKYNNAITWNDNKFVKLNVEVSDEAKGANGKLEWETHLASVRTLTGRVTQERPGNEIITNLAAAFAYEGKTADIDLKVTANPGSGILNAYVEANVPNKGKFTADLKHQESGSSNTNRTRDTTLVLTGDNKTVKVTHSLKILKPNLAEFVLLVEVPQGKSGVDIKIVRKGVRKYAQEQKFYWLSGGGGNLDLDIEYDFEEFKDFSLKVNADSEKLSIDKFQFEAGSKAAVKTSGKHIVFSAKTASKNLFSGSLNYKVEDQLPESLSLNGDGVLRVGTDTYPLKVKLDYEQKSPETTLALSIDAKPYSWVSVLGRKDVNMKVSHKYCKGSVCAKVEAEQFVEVDHKDGPSFSIKRHVSIELESLIDNIKNFNLDSSFVHKGPLVEHKVTSSYGTYATEYEAYIRENEAGIALTLPSRVIALEINHDNALSGKGKGLPEIFEITFYPNKKLPNEKTSLSYKSNVSKFLKNSATGQFTSELQFSAPGVRDLLLKVHGEVSGDYKNVEGNIDIDIFNKKPNRIVIDFSRNYKQDQHKLSFDHLLKIHSKGQDIDFQSKQTLALSRESFEFNSNSYYIDSKKVKQEGILEIEVSDEKQVVLIKLPEGVLLSFNSRDTENKDGYTMVTDYEVFGRKLSERLVVNKNKISYVGTFGKEVFRSDLGFALGQLIEYKASLNDKLLADVVVKLDNDNFLKTSYNYDIDTIKALIESVKAFDLDIYNEYAKVIKAIVERVTNEYAARIEEIRKAAPNFKPVFNAYNTQLKNLKEEIENNENLKDIVDAFKAHKSVIVDQIIEVYQEAAKAAESLLNLIEETWKKLNESVAKFIPKFNDAFNRVVDSIKLLIEEAYTVTTNILVSILDEVKKHNAEFKEIITLASDFLLEIGHLIARSTKQIQDAVQDFIYVIKEQIESLQIVAVVQEKIKELKEYKIPDHALGMFSEFVQTAKQGAPTPELQTFIESLGSYIEKLLKQEPVDDVKELKEIYKYLISALRSLVPLYNPKNPDAPFEPVYELFQSKIIQPLKLYQPPRGGIRFSLFSLLQSPDLPSLTELYQTYKPTKYIVDYFPPYKGYASYADSTEIITFDGQQLSFKGSCGYILLQDYVDGNFSVAATLENGKVKSLVITDHDNIVELQSDHSVVVNGKNSEYPVSVGDIEVWRRYHSVGVFSKAGLRILCVESLEHCSFVLSGYYFGKTRGLLGTYNNEPYDDLTAPAGNVCGSESEFGNAWKTSGQCSDVPQVRHNHVHSDECTEYFTAGSPFQSCFPYNNPENYRKSCDHKVKEAQGGKKQETLCNILEAYVGSCLAHHVNIKLPKECISCKIGSTTVNYGESVSVNTPQDSADVVILLEELEYNEDVYQSLILPLIPLLTNDLKERGITDVKFALIGYGAPGNYWASHYTTDGEIQFKGKADISFGKLINNTSRGDFVSTLRFLKQQFDLEFGLTPWHKALEEVMFYPFRAEAVKSVIAVYAKPCDTSALPVSTLPLQHLAGTFEVIKSGTKLTVITPLKDLAIDGKDAKASANIVGFDSEAVYMQGEAKRKVLRGDEEAYKNLKYSPDRCVDFAQSVNGAVFSSDNFIQGKPGLRKNFLQVLSEKITEDLTGVEIQQECKCELDRFFPLTRCKVVSRKEKEMLAKNVKTGVKG